MLPIFLFTCGHAGQLRCGPVPSMTGDQVTSGHVLIYEEKGRRLVCWLLPKSGDHGSCPTWK